MWKNLIELRSSVVERPVSSTVDVWVMRVRLPSGA
jgi:hypothetical protein